MKYGHTTGRKQEKKGSTDWYTAIEAAHLAHIEAAWAAQPHTPRAYAAMALACGSTLDLGSATQGELDALVREYLTTAAALQAN